MRNYVIDHICRNVQRIHSRNFAHKLSLRQSHDDVIKWKHFPRFWPFVPVTGEFPSQSSDAELWCFLICAWTNDWINNRDAGDMRGHRAHYDVTVMMFFLVYMFIWNKLACEQTSIHTDNFITITSRWRLKSPASRLFTQPCIQAQIKYHIKAPRHWPLWIRSSDNDSTGFWPPGSLHTLGADGHI